MDAVFGLCRKKSSGASVRSPLFSGLFFEEQKAVDDFVSNYDLSSQVMDKVCQQIAALTVLFSCQKGCHMFLAGDALRSKSRYAALDETAVFGSVCRHEFPQRFQRMKHGEAW